MPSANSSRKCEFNAFLQFYVCKFTHNFVSANAFNSSKYIYIFIWDYKNVVQRIFHLIWVIQSTYATISFTFHIGKISRFFFIKDGAISWQMRLLDPFYIRYSIQPLYNHRRSATTLPAIVSWSLFLSTTQTLQMQLVLTRKRKIIHLQEINLILLGC